MPWSTERQQIVQMASKKIELERRIRALRVRGDEVSWLTVRHCRNLAANHIPVGLEST